MTTDDELLAQVSAAARADLRAGADEPLADPRWERLASPDLPAEERAALEAALAATPGGDDLAALLRPLDGAAKGRALAGVRKAFAAPAASGAELVPLPAERPAGARRARLFAVAASAVSLAAAAAALLVVAPRGVEPLPAYSMHVTGAIGETRAGEPRAPRAGGYRVAPGGELTVGLRPREDISGAVVARALVTGAEVREVPVEIAPSGGVRVTLGYDALASVPGARELVVVVGRPGAVPAAPSEAATVAEGPGVHVARIAVALASP